MTVEDAKFAAPAADRPAGSSPAKKDEASPPAAAGGASSASPPSSDGLTFAAFQSQDPIKANQYLNQLSEITGESIFEHLMIVIR